MEGSTLFQATAGIYIGSALHQRADGAAAAFLMTLIANTIEWRMPFPVCGIGIGPELQEQFYNWQASIGCHIV